jgi:hypothetical protein
MKIGGEREKLLLEQIRLQPRTTRFVEQGEAIGHCGQETSNIQQPTSNGGRAWKLIGCWMLDVFKFTR